MNLRKYQISFTKNGTKKKVLFNIDLTEDLENELLKHLLINKEFLLTQVLDNSNLKLLKDISKMSLPIYEMKTLFNQLSSYKMEVRMLNNEVFVVIDDFFNITEKFVQEQMYRNPNVKVNIVNIKNINNFNDGIHTNIVIINDNLQLFSCLKQRKNLRYLKYSPTSNNLLEIGLSETIKLLM